MSDQLVAENDTYTIHNKHNRPAAGFESVIPAIPDLRVRPHGHWYRLKGTIMNNLYVASYVGLNVIFTIRIGI